MIYTVTMNPSLDYVVKVDSFETGEVNQTSKEYLFCGGKGINVSAVLAALGFESRALGFVAGFTGEEILRRIETMGFQADFIRLKEGRSRINIKLKSDQETEINGQGPEIKAAELEALLQKVKKLEDGDVMVLSGSVPPSVGKDVYSQMMEQVSGKNVLTAVDGRGGTITSRPAASPLFDQAQPSGTAGTIRRFDGHHGRDQSLRLKASKNGSQKRAGFHGRPGAACGGATAFSEGIATGEEIWGGVMEELLHCTPPQSVI